MKKILLDTNAYSRFLAKEKPVKDAIENANTTFMSVITIGELYSGFRRGNQETANKKLLRAFIDKPSVSIIHITEETADHYAHIKYALKRKGEPIPSNDVWIAACALETASVLITYDRHFTHIPGLRLWKGEK